MYGRGNRRISLRMGRNFIGNHLIVVYCINIWAQGARPRAGPRQRTARLRMLLRRLLANRPRQQTLHPHPRFPRNPPKLPLSRPTLRLHDPTPLHQKALHLKKTQDPPEEARKRFAALVTIQSTSRTANGPSDHIKSFERGDLKLPPSAGLAWYPGGVDVISETGHVSQLTRIQTQIGILPPAETRRRRRHALPLPHPSILGL